MRKGKVRQDDLITLRVRGPEQAVKEFMEQYGPVLNSLLQLQENKQNCRIGRAVNIGTDPRSRKPKSEVHIQLPKDVMIGSIKTNDINNTVGPTTDEEEQDSETLTS